MLGQDNVQKHLSTRHWEINKEKTPVKGVKGAREEKRKDWSPNKRPHSKVRNTQWGALRGENMKPKT